MRERNGLQQIHRASVAYVHTHLDHTSRALREQTRVEATLAHLTELETQLGRIRQGLAVAALASGVPPTRIASACRVGVAETDRWRIRGSINLEPFDLATEAMALRDAVPRRHEHT